MYKEVSVQGLGPGCGFYALLFTLQSFILVYSVNPACKSGGIVFFLILLKTLTFSIGEKGRFFPLYGEMPFFVSTR